MQFFHDPLVVGTSVIQERSKTHEVVSRSKTELWHRILTHYLPLYFPEAERFRRGSRTDWFLAFLEDELVQLGFGDDLLQPRVLILQALHL